MTESTSGRSSLFPSVKALRVQPDLDQLFSALNAQDIRWAIWKSLEFLETQLDCAGGDIDLLIDAQQRADFLSCAANYGFVLDKRSVSGNGRDIIVLRHFSAAQDKKIMLHVHAQLRVGSKEFKEFRIPIERQVLDNRYCVGSVQLVSDADFFALRTLAATLKDRAREDTFAKQMLINCFDGQTKKSQEMVDALVAYSEKDFVLKIVDEVRRGDFPSAETRRVGESMVQRIGIGPRERLRFFALKRLPRRNKLGPFWINIYGHDGAGKTTAQNEVVKTLRKFGPTFEAYLGRNTWTRLNRAIYSAQSSHKFLRPIWKASSFIELYLRHLRTKALYHAGRSVVVDRGLLDVGIKYASSESPLGSFLGRLATTIDRRSGSLKILLVCDPLVAARRDGKLGAEEIARRNRGYEQALRTNVPTIDTTMLSKAEVAQKIVDAAQVYFGRKNAN